MFHFIFAWWILNWYSERPLVFEDLIILQRLQMICVYDYVTNICLSNIVNENSTKHLNDGIPWMITSLHFYLQKKNEKWHNIGLTCKKWPSLWKTGDPKFTKIFSSGIRHWNKTSRSNRKPELSSNDSSIFSMLI